MRAREVNLSKRIQTPRGLRYCRVIWAPNGRIKPHVVLIDGKEVVHSEGSYYIEWREDGKRLRLSVGNDPVEAAVERQRKEAELGAVRAGLKVTDPNGRKSLRGAVDEYLSDTRLTKKPKTLAAYTTALHYFQESCHRQYVEEITRTDMLKFAAFLRDEKDQSPRSCWNKFSNTMSFLKAQGVRGLVGKNNWPRFTEEEPEIYEREELEKLFDACDDEERLWFQFFLKTGMREQEVMHCYWSNVKFNDSTITVTHKPDRGWTPKAYKEREIPVPLTLIEALKGHRERRANGCNLVFPTSGCNPKLDFLDCLKAVVERADLSGDWFLHKFRATFATWHLWAGEDLRTVQSWLGHTDMESTMRYLKPARGKKVHEKVNETFAKL